MKLILFLLFAVLSLAGAEKHSNWILQRKSGNTALILHVPEGGSIHAVTVSPAAAVIQAPSPVLKDGEKVFTGTNTWRLSGTADKVTVQWQECTADGQCRLPETKSFTLSGKSAQEKTPVPVQPFTELRRLEGYHSPEAFARFLDGTAKEKRNFLEGKGFFLLLLLTLLGGAALNFTPCVLPLIPVNLAIISAGRNSAKERFLTAVCYGGGMAFAYGLTGFLALAGGKAASVWNPASKWYFNLGVGLLFIFLALAMFDLFFLDLTRFRSRFSVSGAKNTGVFVLGGIAALLAGACVAPVVIAVLLESARRYAEGETSAVLLPFVLGIGMGGIWPLFAAGLTVLPKPGKWMAHLKHLLGVLILIPGIWYVITGITLLIQEKTHSNSSVSLEKALQQAKSERKAILLDFTASWCKNCKAMDKTVLNKPEIRKKMGRYIFVRIDATDSGSPEVRKILENCKVSGLPAFLIVIPQK